MPKIIAPKAQQKSFLGDVGGFLGKAAGEAVGGLLGLRRGGKAKKMKSPEKMKRGGKAAHLVKGSAAAKAFMARLRKMRK